MAKKRRRMSAMAIKAAAAKAIVPNFSPGICLGGYGSSTVWSDSNGKLWHVEIGDGIVRPAKVQE